MVIGLDIKKYIDIGKVLQKYFCHYSFQCEVFEKREFCLAIK